MGGEGLAAFAATRTLCASWFCWRPCPFGRAAVRNGQDRRQQRNKQRSRFATFRGSVRQEHRSRLVLEKRSKRRTRDRVRYAVALWLVLVFPVSQAKWQPSDDPYARFFGPDPKRVAQEESVAGGPCGTTYVMLPSLLGGVRGGGRRGEEGGSRFASKSQKYSCRYRYALLPGTKYNRTFAGKLAQHKTRTCLRFSLTSSENSGEGAQRRRTRNS